jgi:hypothetical protein
LESIFPKHHKQARIEIKPGHDEAANEDGNTSEPANLRKEINEDN